MSSSKGTRAGFAPSAAGFLCLLLAFATASSMAWAVPSISGDTASAEPGVSAPVVFAIQGGSSSYGGLHVILELPEGVSFGGAAALGGLSGFTLASNEYDQDGLRLVGIIAHADAGSFGLDGDLFEVVLIAETDAAPGTRSVTIAESYLSDESGGALIEHFVSDASFIVEPVGGLPLIEVSPGAVEYEDVTVGSSEAVSIRVTNSGSGMLVGQATAADPFFVLAGDAYNLAAGESQIIIVRFAPSAAGVASDFVTFSDGGDAAVSVTGTGFDAIDPLIFVSPAFHDLSHVLVGSQTEVEFLVINKGGGTLFGDATVEAPFEIISGGSYALVAGQRLKTRVLFSPQTVADFDVDVSFSGDVLLTKALLMGTADSGIGSLAGFLTDAGSGDALSCGTVVVFDDDGFEAVATIDYAGRFEAKGIPVGSYEVEVYAPGFATTGGSVEIFDGAQTDADFELAEQASAGLLRGTVRDMDTETPLAGVRVDLLLSEAIISTAYTCADGRYELELSGLKSVAVMLRFSADGFEEKIVEVSIEPDEVNELDAFLVAKVALPGAIVGEVVDATTNVGIRDVRVVAKLKGSRTEYADFTTADGLFFIPGVESGNYEVRASAPGFDRAEEDVTVFGIDPPAQVTIELDGDSGGGTGGCASNGIGGASPFARIGDGLLLLLLVGAFAGRTARRVDAD